MLSNRISSTFAADLSMKSLIFPYNITVLNYYPTKAILQKSPTTRSYIVDSKHGILNFT